MKKSFTRRLISMLLAVVITMGAVPFTALPVAAAATGSDNGFEYRIEIDKVTITGYTGSETAIKIPSEIAGYPVTAIGDSAFENCYSLTSLFIPKSVTNIGMCSFGRKTKVYYEGTEAEWANISVAVGAKFLGGIVYGCKNTEADYIVSWHENGKSLKIEKYLGSDTDVTVPSEIDGITITGIADRAFFNNEIIKTVKIPDSITDIGGYAFAYCTGLESIELPEGITRIERDLFSNCTSLESIELPQSLTYIGSSAFEGCQSLADITLPKSLGTIDSNAFLGCKSLDMLFVLNTGIKVEHNTFNDCPLSWVFYVGTDSDWRNSELYDVIRYSITIVNYLMSVDEFAIAMSDDGQSVKIAKYLGNSAEVTVPAELYGYPVTSIVTKAFSGQENLESIVLSEGLTSIGYNAFEGCVNLTDITIPEGLKTIRSKAFYGCTALQKVVLPDSITSIEATAFGGCTALSDITVPSGFVEIHRSAFDDTAYYYNRDNWKDGIFYVGTICMKAETVESVSGDFVFEAGITAIAEYAFSGSTGITSIYIPLSVACIGENAFTGCTALERVYYEGSSQQWTQIRRDASLNLSKVTKYYNYYLSQADFVLSFGQEDQTIIISDYTGNASELTVPAEINGYTVVGIGDGALSDCDSLTRINLPDGIKTIGSAAFSGCDNLERINLPGGIKTIGSAAFSGCDNLEKITLPEGIEAIGAEAFRSCTSLELLIIPESVKTIGTQVVKGCSRLSFICYCGTSNQWDTIKKDYGNSDLNNKTKIYNVLKEVDGVVYVLDTKNNVAIASKYVGNASDVTIQKIIDGVTVTSLANSLFSDRSSLKMIVIPESITSIGASAFYNCKNLETVYYYGTEDQWNKIKINYSNDYLKSAVKVYSFFAEIDGVAYSLNADGVTVTVARYTGDNEELVIPESVEGYTVTGIGSRAFENNTSIVSLTIPKTVTDIGRRIVEGCTSLTTINVAKDNPCYYSEGNCLISSSDKVLIAGCQSSYITGGVKMIAEYAFYNCTGLSVITIPEGITGIGAYAFAGCTSLNGAVIPVGLTDIGENAFSGCTSFTDLTIHEGAVIIGEGAFSECTSLANVIILNGLTSIGKGAFSGCTSLTAITVHSGLTSIGEDAFLNCTSLSVIILCDSVREVGKNAFHNTAYYNNRENWLDGYLYLGSILLQVEENENDYYIVKDGTITIASYAFESCMSSADVLLPDSLKNICDYAFHVTGYGKMDNVYFPGTKEQWDEISIGNNNNGLTGATIYCNYFQKTDEFILSFDNENQTVGIEKYLGEAESIVIPDELYGYPVDRIGNNAFKDLSVIKTISIPESIKTIEGYAFYNCVSLESVDFPDGLTNIGEYAFCNCVSLESVNIPDGVSNIGVSAFSNCEKITSIIIPEGITVVNESTFKGCTGLEIVTVPKSITKISYYAFDGCTALTTLNYFGSISEWKNVDTPGFNDYTFSNVKRVYNYGTEIEGLEYTINSNGQASVTGYTGSRKDIIIPSEIEGHPVTCIKDGAFKNCLGIESVTIHEGVLEICAEAFNGCIALESVSLPQSLEVIASDAFCNTLIYNTGANWEDGALYIGNALIKTNDSMPIDFAIKDGTVIIANKAFYNMTHLESVTMPESIRAFGTSIFGLCSSLGTINYYGTSQMWKDIINLKSINTSKIDILYNYETELEGISYIVDEENGEVIITGFCKSKTTLTVPAEIEGYPVARIGKEAFVNLTNLECVILPDTITELEYGVFKGCESLTGISIPDSVAEIGASAFYNCKALASVVLPKGITSIKSSTFWGCTSLVSIELGEALTCIESYAFEKCTSLASINIPEGILEVAEYAFVDCESLKTVTLTKNTTISSGYAFYNCNIDRVYFYGTRTEWENIVGNQYNNGFKVKEVVYNCGTDIEGIVYRIGNKGVEITGYLGKSSKLVIPKTIEGYVVVSVDGFDDNIYLSSITIPDGVTEIGSYAFYRCSLREISLPSSLKSIGYSAFKMCFDLSKVYFRGTSSQWFRISIEGENSYLTNATRIYEYSKKVDGVTYTIDTDAKFATVSGFDGSVTDVVICNQVDGYPVTIIGNNAFSKSGSWYSGQITSITLPKGLKSISSYAFSSCDEITELIIPEGVTTIEQYAFSFCEKLKKVVLPESIKTIGSNIFNYCSNMEVICYYGSPEQWKDISIASQNWYYSNIDWVYDYITEKDGIVYSFNSTGTEAVVSAYIGTAKRVSVPDTVEGYTVTSIAGGIFDNRNDIEYVTLPGTISSIGESVFYYCTALKKITIRDGVTNIGNSAFYGCENLETVVIPASVVSIGRYAFYNCDKLSKVLYSGNADQWSAIEIGEYNYCLTWAAKTYDYNIPELDVVMGDFSGDGEVNAKDSNLFKRVIAGATNVSKDSDEFVAIDLNGDGELNAKDSNILKRIIAGAVQLSA